MQIKLKKRFMWAEFDLTEQVCVSPVLSFQSGDLDCLGQITLSHFADLCGQVLVWWAISIAMHPPMQILFLSWQHFN